MGGTLLSRAATARRVQGRKKKAAEIGALCDVDFCYLGLGPGPGPDGELFSWLEDVTELRRAAERYLDAVGGGSGTAVGKKRRKAEAAVVNPCSGSSPGSKRNKRETDMVAYLGGHEVVVNEAIGDDDGGGAITVPLFPSLADIRSDEGFNLHVLASPSSSLSTADPWNVFG